MLTTLKLDAMRLKMYPSSEPASPCLSFTRFAWFSSLFSLIIPNDPWNDTVVSLELPGIRHSHRTTAFRGALLLPPPPLLPSVAPLVMLRSTLVQPSVCHPRVFVFHHAHHTHHTSELPAAENRAVLARCATLFPHTSSVWYSTAPSGGTDAVPLTDRFPPHQVHRGVLQWGERGKRSK